MSRKYFLGLPWLHTLVSATLGAVGGDARYLAERMGLIDAAEVEAVTA